VGALAVVLGIAGIVTQESPDDVDEGVDQLEQDTDELTDDVEDGVDDLGDDG
jgi:hypothetical protein